MYQCPSCGTELPVSDTVACQSCGKPIREGFTIRKFLWENFRLFTMIGVTGTMISLIPNMGERVLGTFRITGSDFILPLLLSIIIFFGAIFLSICFLMIFGLIWKSRDEEATQDQFTLFSKTHIRWHTGDTQRFILLICLIPMWIGMTLFFILLLPLIPSSLSSLFALVTLLACVPLAAYAFFGWTVGKTVASRIPGGRTHPRLILVLTAVVIICCLVFIPLIISETIAKPRMFSGAIGMQAEPEYYSPHISSEKGVHLKITNLSTEELYSSSHTWSADYGYFVWVTPTTNQVTILGNPVTDTSRRDIYWTWSDSDTLNERKPVRIGLEIIRSEDNQSVATSELYLNWYTKDIVQINRSYLPS